MIVKSPKGCRNLILCSTAPPFSSTFIAFILIKNMPYGRIPPLLSSSFLVIPLHTLALRTHSGLPPQFIRPLMPALLAHPNI